MSSTAEEQQPQQVAAAEKTTPAVNNKSAAATDSGSNATAKTAAPQQQIPKQQQISSSTALRICFMRLCEFGAWRFSTIESRRRRFLAEHPKLTMPAWGTNTARATSTGDQHHSPSSTSTTNNPLNSFATTKHLYEEKCTLEAALVGLSALDEQTAQQYVLEELQYYVLIQTVLHGDPISERITVAEAATLFKARAHRPAITYQGFERLFDSQGVDEQGMRRLEALLDAQRAACDKLAFLEDKEESFDREQIIRECTHEAGEILSAIRRMQEVAELKAQLSRATSRKIEQAQVLSNLGALHLESVKKDVAQALADSEDAKKLATAVESTIATARNTAEALSEETGVNSRFFEEEKSRVIHSCQDGCRDVLNLAHDRWSLLEMRMERLERLMTSVGRSAVVCSMTHLPLAEHRKLLLGPVEEKTAARRLGLATHHKNQNKNEVENENDDNNVLDQSLEWLKLSTAERFGLMSSCHVLKDNDPEEHLVTSAVALTLSDSCVLNTKTSTQIDSAVLACSIAFLGLTSSATTTNNNNNSNSNSAAAAKLFLHSSRQNLLAALDQMVRSTTIPGLFLDEFLESLSVDLPGGAALWRAAQQRLHAKNNNNNNSSSSSFYQQQILGLTGRLNKDVTHTQSTMIGSTRFKNVATPGIHNRYHPSTQSTLRVGISPMDYAIMAGNSIRSNSDDDYHQNNNNTGGTTTILNNLSYIEKATNNDDDGGLSLAMSPQSEHHHQQNNSIDAAVDGFLSGGGGGNDTMSSNDQLSYSRHQHHRHSKFADAQSLVEAASCTTLAEFVRILTDVARLYLGSAATGCSPEFCLSLICQWKITPLIPLLPLLSVSFMLRQQQEQQQQQNFLTSLKFYHQQLQQDRQLFNQQRFSNAWGKVVGSSDPDHPQQPTVGDVASFMLAHFPDVIAATRGWDASPRAGFSGTEVFVIRAVLYVLLVVGMKNRNSSSEDDGSQNKNNNNVVGVIHEFDFVRARIGEYSNNNKEGERQSVSVDFRAISSQEMHDFISSRPCPWEYIVTAWPEGSNSSTSSAQQQRQQTSSSSSANNNNNSNSVVSDDMFLFKEAIADSGLPVEVLQALPAWETIAGVVKRAEHSLAVQ